MKSKIEGENFKKFQDVTLFHGHICPGSALGYKASIMALKYFSVSQSPDDELLAIVENDSCAVDALQVLTGCTFGKGNLIFKDHGKQVYTFINRKKEKGIRLSIKKSFSIEELDPSLPLLRKKLAAGEISQDEKKNLQEKVVEVSQKILEMDEDQIFDLKISSVELPQGASIYKNIKCESCGEPVSEHRACEFKEKVICIPCYEEKVDD